MIRSLGRARGACMFCGGRVGTNTVLKSSRVGAHIAFSESRCRVWLVCATCDRWNLVEPDSATAMLRECCAVFRSTAEREVSDGIGQVVSGSFRATNIDEQSPVDFLVHRHARRIQRAMRRRAVLTVPYLSAVFVPIIAANQLWWSWCAQPAGRVARSCGRCGAEPRQLRIRWTERTARRRAGMHGQIGVLNELARVRPVRTLAAGDAFSLRRAT